jgi:hypothetical protein
VWWGWNYKGQQDGEGYVAEILAVNYAYGIDQPVAECYDRICESEKLNIDERVVGQHSSYICVADSAKGNAHK